MTDRVETEAGLLPFDWSVGEFQSVFEIPLRNGLTKPSRVRGEGVKMVNMGEIFAHSAIGCIDMDRVPVSDSELEKSSLKPNDLLFARQSLVLEGAGKCSIFTCENEPAVFESHLIRARLCQDQAVPYFYFYYFNSPRGRWSIGSITEQVAAAGIRGSDLAKLPIPLPPLREQAAIAEALSSLDEKIELNRKQNRTLEAIAQALFKHWFVDFEFPDENGRPYKSSGGAMQPSELGEIPDRWSITPLQECFNFLEGPGIRNWQYVQDGTRFINIRLIKNLDIDVSSASCVSDDEANGKYNHFKLSEKDVVISTSGTLGKCAIVRNSHLPLLLNTSVIRFRPLEPFSLGYMYCYLNSLSFKEELLLRASGSVQLNFGPTHLKQIIHIRPDDRVLAKFAEIADPLVEKIIANLNEIETLRQLRDTLLPKLMSGELRVA